jgi:mRNA-degrading endonuclease toxin of MazEF toxin-antitoxin module
VLADQLTAVDRSRLGSSAGTLTWEELVEVDTAIQVVLGLTR